MFLTNHTLTGTLIGLSLPAPAVLPLGFLSHLALDATPHFGYPSLDLAKNPGFSLAVFDGLASAATYLFMLGMFPDHRVAITLGVFGATLPDLLYIPRYIFRYRPTNFFARLHKKIQWSETPAGLITEFFWALLMLRLIL